MTRLQKLEDILDGQTYWELDELTDLIHDMAKKEREQKPPLMSMDTKTGEVTIVNEQKPTANADLVGELEAFCEPTLAEINPKSAHDKKYAPVIKVLKARVRAILSKYRPVPVVKEQHKAPLCHLSGTECEGEECIEENYGACPNVGEIKEQGEAGLRNKAYGECKNVGKTCRACHAEHCTTRVYFIPTPAPVANGLVEYLEHEIHLLKNEQSHVGPFQEGMTYAYENILSRYSKEAK